jgi:hypothetical protein
MKTCPGCTALVVGEASVCPDCGATLPTAPAPAGGPVPPRAPSQAVIKPVEGGPNPVGETDAFARKKVHDSVRSLGTWYIVVASIGILGALYLSQSLFREGLTAAEIKIIEDAARRFDPVNGQESAAMTIRMMESGVPGYLGVTQLLLYGFVLWAGIELRNIRYRPAALTAAALLLLLPVIGINVCTCFSFTCFAQPVLAIYALVLLTSFPVDRLFAERVGSASRMKE